MELKGEITYKDIYKLKRLVNPNIREVKALAKTSSFIPTYAVEHMDRINKQIKKTPIKRMSTTELRNLYRDLIYIKDNLKSSTLEGALAVKENFEENIGTYIKDFTEDEKKKFFKLYDAFYDKLGEQQSNLFKYEVMKFSVSHWEKLNDDDYEDLVEVFKAKIKKITEEVAKIPKLTQEERENRERLLFSKYLHGVRE